jgi:hypothetical protein
MKLRVSRHICHSSDTQLNILCLGEAYFVHRGNFDNTHILKVSFKIISDSAEIYLDLSEELTVEEECVFH